MKFKKFITNIDNLRIFKNLHLEEAVKSPDLVKGRVLIFDLRQTGINEAKAFEYDGYYDKWRVYNFSLIDGETIYESKKLYSDSELLQELPEFFEKVGFLVKK